MRASRLLHILLLLQNRGRMTARSLADELEVTHRTVLRDMDALTEAGLPIIAFQGNQGGFELGFDYRTRLTGMDADEAEALAVLLDASPPRLKELGIADAARRAASKVRESLPDPVRQRLAVASQRFPVRESSPVADPDPRIVALANAVRKRAKVRLNARSSRPLQIHPVALAQTDGVWSVIDEITGAGIPLAEWGDVNVSGLTF
jgi:predicted DNA-binding transcriptional regulator YafY